MARKFDGRDYLEGSLAIASAIVSGLLAYYAEHPQAWVGNALVSAYFFGKISERRGQDVI